MKEWGIKQGDVKGERGMNELEGKAKKTMEIKKMEKGKEKRKP